jgi:hypothetical protein
MNNHPSFQLILEVQWGKHDYLCGMHIEILNVSHYLCVPKFEDFRKK